MAQQNDTKYHQLFLMLKTADDFFPKEERKELLDLVKDLFDDYSEKLQQKDYDGKYGIRYSTIHDDSRFADKHQQFFSSLERRDKVYDDWEKGYHWDTIFDKELEYPVPGPNFHNMFKIFKEQGKVYDEQ